MATYAESVKPRWVGPLPERSWERPLPCNTGAGKGETDRAFAMFQEYLKLPLHERTVLKAAENYYKLIGSNKPERRRARKAAGKIGAANSEFANVYVRSRRWRWADRAKQRDEYLARAATDEAEARVREMISRHQRLSAAMAELAAKGIEELKKPERLRKIYAEDIRGFAVEGMRMERLAHGLPERMEKAEQQVNSTTTSTVTVAAPVKQLLTNPRVQALTEQLLAEVSAIDESSDEDTADPVPPHVGLIDEDDEDYDDEEEDDE